MNVLEENSMVPKSDFDGNGISDYVPLWVKDGSAFL